MKKTSFAILIGPVLPFPCAFLAKLLGVSSCWKRIPSSPGKTARKFINPTFNDSKWQTVTVPYDWAIYGPFNSQNDNKKVAIAQDGTNGGHEHAGRTAGLPFVGVGWYWIEFEVSS